MVRICRRIGRKWHDLALLIFCKIMINKTGIIIRLNRMHAVDRCGLLLQM